MSGNISNQPSKFRTKNWVQKNDESRGNYCTGSQIISKTSTLKSNLCDDNTLLKERITITRAGADTSPRQTDETKKEVVFKNCPPFNDGIREINDTQVDNAIHLDVVMPMCNLKEYSDNYSKKSGSLWKYYRDEPALDNNDSIVNFPVNSA